MLILLADEVASAVSTLKTYSYIIFKEFWEILIEVFLISFKATSFLPP
tara:strand:+ start:121 stop:264 length:144 start_codon:yes stop_codon:yes gene_type:complete